MSLCFAARLPVLVLDFSVSHSLTACDTATPTAQVRIHVEVAPGLADKYGKSGSPSRRLPQGYRYCWHRLTLLNDVQRHICVRFANSMYATKVRSCGFSWINRFSFGFRQQSPLLDTLLPYSRIQTLGRFSQRRRGKVCRANAARAPTMKFTS